MSDQAAAVQEPVAVAVPEVPMGGDPQPQAEPQQEPAQNPQEPASEPQGAEPQQEPQEPKPDRVQRRIDKLTREKYELKGRLEALEQYIQQNGQQPAQPQYADQPGKPVRDQYDTDEAYIDALTDYKVLQATARQAQQQATTQAQSTFQQQAAKARETMPDFDEVLDDVRQLRVHPDVNMAIMTSDLGPQILYELGKDIEQAVKLSRMPPAIAIREIGKIEARIAAKAQAPATPAPKPVTKAPEPVKPVASRGSSPKRDHLEHPEDYTAEEWRAAERERVSKLNRR